MKKSASFILACCSSLFVSGQNFINPSLESWGVPNTCEINVAPDFWTNYSSGGIGADEAHFTFCPTTIPPSASLGIVYARMYGNGDTLGEGFCQDVSGFVLCNTYNITFDYAGSNLYGGGANAQIHLLIDNVDVFQTPSFASTKNTWSTATYVLTPTKGTYKIGFRGCRAVGASSGTSSSGLDNIRISIASGLNSSISSFADVTCFGLTNGVATASTSGGTGPYTYSWNPGGYTSGSVSSLGAGTYVITITDNTGCSTTTTVAINSPTALNTSTGTAASTCGQANGSASVTASGGTGPYTYSWSNGATQSSINNLLSTIYTVTITDSKGCTKTATVNVGNTGNITAAATATAANCGQSNGSTSLTTSGGTGAYTYSWNPGGQTTAGATGLSAGTYTVLITDNNGCTATATAAVNSNSSVTATATATATVACNGGSNGSATASGNGGTGPYTYSWSNGSTQSSINNLQSTIYSVTVTDANGCTSTQTVSITQPAALTATATATAANCGQSDGTASVSVTGGTGAYTYSWSTGASTANIQNLAGSIYLVSVTDNNGCTKTVQVNVTQNGGPTATATATATTIQQGQSTTLNGTGGGTYTWSPSGGLSCTNCQNPVASPTITTQYCLTVTDINGCTATACVTVFVETPCPSNDSYQVPNAFSPNGDGSNDVFTLHGWKDCIKEFAMVIYDRWGERVFESSDPAQSWDGNLNGKPMDTAVFVYYISATNTNGEAFIRKGNISLLR